MSVPARDREPFSLNRPRTNSTEKARSVRARLQSCRKDSNQERGLQPLRDAFHDARSTVKLILAPACLCGSMRCVARLAVGLEAEGVLRQRAVHLDVGVMAGARLSVAFVEKLLHADGAARVHPQDHL